MHLYSLDFLKCTAGSDRYRPVKKQRHLRAFPYRLAAKAPSKPESVKWRTGKDRQNAVNVLLMPMCLRADGLKRLHEHFPVRSKTPFPGKLRLNLLLTRDVSPLGWDHRQAANTKTASGRNGLRKQRVSATIERNKTVGQDRTLFVFTQMPIKRVEIQHNNKVPFRMQPITSVSCTAGVKVFHQTSERLTHYVDIPG